MISSARIDTWRTHLRLLARTDHDRSAEVRDVLVAEKDRLNDAANRFTPDSELSAVNRGAGRWVDVSWYFVEVLTAAIHAAESTDGLVSPILGRQVDAAGYRSWRTGAVPVVRSTPRPTMDLWRRIEIEPAGSGARVRIPPGAALDLGAIGKAWLADRLATRLSRAWDCDVLADMGGDIRVVGREPWVVAVDPGLPGIPLQKLLLADGGMATSGTGRRRWQTSDGAEAHHIIDPRTGCPAATCWHTTSVWAVDAQVANTASTAAIVAGREAPEHLKALDCRLVRPDGTDLRLGRWPKGETTTTTTTTGRAA